MHIMGGYLSCMYWATITQSWTNDLEQKDWRQNSEPWITLNKRGDDVFLGFGTILHTHPKFDHQVVPKKFKTPRYKLAIITLNHAKPNNEREEDTHEVGKFLGFW